MDLKKKHGIQYVIHYLDDLLIDGKPDCQQALTFMLHTCQQLGFPIAEGKIEGPDTTLVFLGILLDTVKLEKNVLGSRVIPGQLPPLPG